jgi:hypothetical protein
MLPILVAIAIFPTPSVKATSSTPVYVLGVTDPLDPLVTDLQGLTSSVTILPGVSSLTLVGSGSILYVDGEWLQTASTLDKTILSLVAAEAIEGVPTVAIRGNPSLLGDSISGLIGTKAVGLPLISQGIQVVGTLPDGTRQAYVLQVIQGFDYAVAAEFAWAQQLLSQTAASFPTIRASSNLKLPRTTTTANTSATPSFLFGGKITLDTGNEFSPMGRDILTFLIFVLGNSGSSSYKWFNFFYNETIQPGILIYNSNWRLSEETDNVNVHNATSNLFVDHGPQGFSTVGGSTLTYTIGTQAGMLGAAATANQTISYFLKNANVTDNSQDGLHLAWDTQFNAHTDAGKLSYFITPGWTDRVRTDGHADLTGSIDTTFATFSGTTVVQESSLLFQISVFGG